MWSGLYPADAQTRAKIDQYLHWHHANTRTATLGLFRYAMIAQMKGEEQSTKHQAKVCLGLTGRSVSAHIHRSERVQATKQVTKWMKIMERWLTEQRYIATDQEPSLADIAAFCEIDQLVSLKLFDFSPFPKVQAWIDRMASLEDHGVRRSLNKFAVKVFKLPQPKF